MWRQGKLGAHWYRLGVVELSNAGPWPFKCGIPHGDGSLSRKWPRVCWYALQKEQYDLFQKERGIRDVI